MNKVIFVTDAAEFTGFHLAETLLNAGHHFFGIDNINDYYY